MTHPSQEPPDAGGTPGPAEALANQQIVAYTQGMQFAWVATALREQRAEILTRWFAAVSVQPFHAGRAEHAVADHIPALFDALLGLLQTTAPTWMDAHAPLEDIGIRAAAQSHARARAAQGLRAADVVVEFRLLRQEIWRAVRTVISQRAPTDDVVAAEMLVNDALDAAITEGLIALSDQVEQVREEFLATTLHDVRQPLTAISGDVQLLARLVRRTPADEARMTAICARLQGSVTQMLTLLETLGQRSRVALGSLELERHAVNLAAVVRAALAHYPPEEVVRVRLVAPAAESELTGLWDARLLEQLVSNLLGNAFKYAPAGTPVVVTLSATGDTATLEVRDEGIGIPPEELTQIFTRYRRGSNAVGQGTAGSGLGLYLCWGIVEAHGGRITAASEGADRGTTITVVLPCQAPAG